MKQISHREKSPYNRNLIETEFAIDENNNLYEHRLDIWYQYRRTGIYTYLSVAKNDNTVWCINNQKKLIKVIGENGIDYLNEEHSPNMTWKSISVYDSHCMIGINEKDEIFQGSGDYWEKLDGLLVNISFGMDKSIWGVNKNQDIYRRDGNKWTHIDGKAIQVSNYDINTVCVCNNDNNIYVWNGSKWNQFNGKLRWISVGKYTCWGCNKEGYVYKLQ
ncbi:MAG: hypothetical protein LBR15_00660 [Methanobrevibacter sp.]|nr:hypothetical protein [Candidatus Methanovirga australis]